MFKKKTVAGILSAFTKTVADLRALEDQKNAEAAAANEKIADLTRDHGSAKDEAALACKKAKQLEEIFG